MKSLFPLKLADFFVNTGEDKIDDLNFAVGIVSSCNKEERLKKYILLKDFFENNHGEIRNKFGFDYSITLFPNLFLINILIKNILAEKHFDKQGKSYGMAFMRKLCSET